MKKNRKKILVIGLSGESVFMHIDHMNENGETIKADLKNTEPGGKGYNQAVALGKLGADVSFITALGNDYYRNECIKVLKEHNVKEYIVDKNVPSSYAVIIVDKEANNNVIVYPGASNEITFEDILVYKNIIDNADIVLIQNEYPQEVTMQIINYCYEQNKQIIFNPAPKCSLDNDVLKKVSILTPNEFELTGLKDINDLNVICTIGSKGVKHLFRGNETIYNAYKVKAIDTTGAGDIFNAGLCYMLACGETIDEAIKFAIASSGYAVQYPGVINSLPTYEDVIKLIKNKNGE